MLGTRTQAQLPVSGPQPGVLTAAGRPGPPAAAQALLRCPSPPARPSQVLPSSCRTRTFLVDRPPTGTPLVTHRCAMSQVSSMSLLPTLSFPCSARCRAQVDRAVTRECPLRRGQARLPVGTRPCRSSWCTLVLQGRRSPPASGLLPAGTCVLGARVRLSLSPAHCECQRSGRAWGARLGHLPVPRRVASVPSAGAGLRASPSPGVSVVRDRFTVQWTSWLRVTNH